MSPRGSTVRFCRSRFGGAFVQGPAGGTVACDGPGNIAGGLEKRTVGGDDRFENPRQIIIEPREPRYAGVQIPDHRQQQLGIEPPTVANERSKAVTLAGSWRRVKHMNSESAS